MTILEITKIDMVATRADSRVVKLVITDHLDWDELDKHFELIQSKINTYIEFVESGQLQEMVEPKIPEHPEVQIVLALENDPGGEGRDFLEKVAEFLKGVNLEFTWSVVG